MDLKIIVESFGATFDSNMYLIASDVLVLMDNKLETGMALVRCVGDDENAGLTVHNMNSKQEVVDFADIFQAQQQWLQQGWISNKRQRRRIQQDEEKYLGER